MNKRNRYNEVKYRVRLLLNISIEDYNNNVLEFSYTFLETKGYSNALIKTLHKTPAYWIWWRNQFGIADMMFLNLYAVFDYHRYSLAIQFDMYKSCHVDIQAYPARLIEKMHRLQTIKN